MLGSWRNRNRGPIGLDIGSHSIKMVQLERRAGRWALAAAASRPLPPGLPPEGPARAQGVAQAVRAMRTGGTGGAFCGDRVVSCLPATAIQYKNLRLPRMPPDEMAGAIQWEATERFKLAADAMQVQFIDAGEVRQGEETRQEIIVMAVTRAAVDAHLDTLLRCDLKPEAIDAVPGALARSMDAGGIGGAGGGTPLTRVVLDVGYSSSKVLITEQGRVVFFKLIDIGGQRFDQMVAQALNLQAPDAADLRRRLGRSAAGAPPEPGAEAALLAAPRRESIERAVCESVRLAAGELTKEVSLCLRYYSVTFRGQRPQVLDLVGGEAHEPQLLRMLSEGAGIEVGHAQAPPEVDFRPMLQQGQAPDTPGTPGTPGMLSEWAVALGLALRHPGVAARSAA